MSHDDSTPANHLGATDCVRVALELLADGPMTLGRLTSALRIRTGDHGVTGTEVENLVSRSGVLVGRPDGTVMRLIDLLDGQVLTLRTRTPTTGRVDLWPGLSLLPLKRWGFEAPIPLAGGGHVAIAEFGHEALVGSRPWLPEVPAGTLLAFRVSEGVLHVDALPDGVDTGPEQELAIRETIARHIRTEQYFGELDDDYLRREEELLRAMSHALLEDPTLLSTPITPLDEMLLGLLQEYSRDQFLDEQSAWTAGQVVSFGVSGMPERLMSELSQRARRYGMSVDRYAVLALGHLCWRTPFAEDLGPDEVWAPRSGFMDSPGLHSL